jgi:SanA protein
LLGTSKTLSNKKAENQYYTMRIEAVEKLYKAGLIEKLIISGDHTGLYNEPLDMFNDLKRMGVKIQNVILDGKGYRTFDSIIRAKLIGGEKNVIIVSQYFHLERALFLADKQGVDAIGFVAGGWPNKKMIKREWLAKTKVLLDIYVLNTQTTGIPVRPRRGVDFVRPADCIILLFVLSSVALAGHLSRQLLSY